MKLRLIPRRHRHHDPVPELGIEDPGPAFRIIDQPDAVESVRRVPLDEPAAATGASGGTTFRAPGGSVRPAPAPPLEAGYRWGMAAARVPCEGVEATSPDHTIEVMPYATGPATLPAVRFERAVLAVAARTEVLASAVARLHDRLDDLDDRFVDLVTHGDLVEIESRRARLAAETARLSVELKAEMDRRLSELGRALVDPRRRSATVDHLGPMDLADAKRVEIHLDRLAEADRVTDLDARRTA